MIPKTRETLEVIKIQCSCGCLFVWTATEKDFRITVECPYCHTDITKSSFDYREVEVEIEQ